MLHKQKNPHQIINNRESLSHVFILIFAIDLIWLKVLLFILSITVPYLKIKDGKLDLESS